MCWIIIIHTPFLNPPSVFLAIHLYGDDGDSLSDTKMCSNQEKTKDWAIISKNEHEAELLVPLLVGPVKHQKVLCSLHNAAKLVYIIAAIGII